MPDDRNDSNFFPGNYSFREPVICGCENIDGIRLNQPVGGINLVRI